MPAAIISPPTRSGARFTRRCSTASSSHPTAPASRSWTPPPYSPLAGGWLSGSWSANSSPTSPARKRLADRFDMSLPENQRKLDAVTQLQKVADDAGLSMIELAIAFVVNHPAVTSAIIGPRTIEQLDSQLPAANAALDAATLDRIDATVAPGVTINPADTSYGEQVLQPEQRRR